MSPLVLVGIAFGLAMDAFAVAAGTSVALGRVTARQVFRFGFHFGLFQAVMPLLGWLAGRSVQRYIETWDHWVAFGLLAFVGFKAIHQALRNDAEKLTEDPTRGANLMLLSVATSIDALAVGLSFAMVQVQIWYAMLIIGVVTAGLTVLGMLIGSRLGSRFGRGMEIVGGLVLIGIGTKILISHMA